MKYGDAVEYETDNGKKQPALIFGGDAHNRDLATIDKNGQWTYHENVPLREEGGGHTFQVK